jgi:beta-glucosidase/6-phospho-beta-glucosidase/beta-galactosidase
LEHLMRRLLILCCLTLCALPAGAAHASRTQTVSFEAPRDLLDPSTREAALDEIQGLGVRALRVILYWRDVAPDPRSATPPSITETDAAAYDWSHYDPLIDSARNRGMKVLLTVSGPVPRWATLSRRDQYTRPSAERFARFAQAVCTHYDGRISL